MAFLPNAAVRTLQPMQGSTFGGMVITKRKRTPNQAPLMTDTADQRPSLFLMRDVVAVLDQRASDAYPVDARVRLAECALRHAGFGRTNDRKVAGAVRWLTERGHI